MRSFAAALALATAVSAEQSLFEMVQSAELTGDLVSDAAQPGELVQTAYVAVSARPGYDPAVTSAPEYPSDGEMFDARLTGWGADQQLRVRVLRRGKVLQRVRVTTDASGTAAVEIGKAGPAAYEVRVRDGLWGEGEAPAFSVWLPS